MNFLYNIRYEIQLHGSTTLTTGNCTTAWFDYAHQPLLTTGSCKTAWFDYAHHR